MIGPFSGYSAGYNMSKQPSELRHLPLGAIAAAVAAGLLGAPVSQAQQGDGAMLEEVVVTAEKREADLQKTSMSIQVFTAEQLRVQGKKRIDEIMRGIVGVASQGSQVGDSFFLRGIGVGSGPQPPGTATPVVAVLIDGVYQNRGETVRGGTLDMAQVEVMRGTQSTTLGAASLAGAVSLVSNDPVFEFEGNGALEFGSFDLTSFEGVVNVPLADNQAIRIAYSDIQRDGYISSGAGDSDLQNYRIKYRIQPNDDLNIVLTASQNKIGGNGVDTSVLTYGGFWAPYNEAQDPLRPVAPPPPPPPPGPPGGPPPPPPPPPPPGPPGGGCMPAPCYDVTMGTLFGHINDGTTYRDRDDPWDDGYPADSWPNSPFRDTTIDQYSVEIEWTTGIGVLSIAPSYQEAHFLSEEPPRGTDWRSEDRRQETTQVDVQLTSSPDMPFEWLAGIYYYDTELDGTFRSAGFPGFGAGPFCPAVSVSESAYCWSFDNNAHETFSVYANAAFPVTDAFRIVAGLRQSDDEKSFLNHPDTPGDSSGPGPGGFPPARTGSREWDDLTYRVGVEYDLTGGDSMVYGIFATGYQAGNIFGFAPAGTVAETLDQLTIGYKSRWLEDRVQFNIEYFDSEYHDRMLDGSVGVEINPQFAPPFPACSAFPFPNAAFYDPRSGYACYQILSSTIPDLISEGVDIELSWLMTDNDRLDLSVEFLDSITTAPTGLPSEAEFASAMNNAGFMDAGTVASMYGNLSALNASYDGLVLQNSPETTMNLTYSHIFQIADGSDLTLSLNAELRSDYWSLGGAPGANIANPGKSIQDDYELFNVYLNWVSADGRWSVNAYARNVGDEAVQTNYGPPFGGGAEYVTLAPPRTYGVGATINF